MGAPEASFQLHSGSEGEDKREKGRRIMRVRVGQSPECCWCWVKTIERRSVLYTGPCQSWALQLPCCIHGCLAGWVPLPPALKEHGAALTASLYCLFQIPCSGLFWYLKGLLFYTACTVLAAALTFLCLLCRQKKLFSSWGSVCTCGWDVT